MAHEAIGPGSLVASRFRLEDLLEEHSGARFWRATDLTLARNVAIHVISADDPRAAAVLTAARTSATVSDGHILRVLDALQEGEVVHVVHEWGSGVSLDRMLADETLDPRRAAWLVREVAEAIAVAHRHGIAHGRLLPENVLLTDAGSVKLIGFVVDAVLHGRPQRVGDEGEPPSEHESDVRNLGALLYACLTGRWPGFPQSLLPDAPLDHDRVCRPRQVRQGVDRDLDTLCDHILNGDPRTGRRYESAVAISGALGEYLGDTLGGAGVALSDPTVFLDPDAFRLTQSGAGDPDDPDRPGRAGSSDGGGSGPGADTAGHDLEATQLTPRGGLDGMGGLEDTSPTMDPVPTTDPVPSADPVPTPPPSGRRVQEDRVPVRTHGLGAAGSVPQHWGPDRVTDSGSWQAVPAAPERPGSTWLRLAAAVGLIALVLLAVVVAFNLGAGRSLPLADDGPEDEPGGDQAPSSEVLEPASVTDFDPDGGPEPEENPQLVPLAVDGDPTTAWETRTYFDGPVMAPYRSGVGLLFDLGTETQVGSVDVTLSGGPYDLQLLAAPEGAGAPSGTDGLSALDTQSGVSGEVTLAGDEPVTTRYVVVWLTALPPTDGGFKGGIAEVVVRS